MQPSYELHSLGWKAFQQLCVSIASDIWGQTVQGFFDSQDGGRDGAFHGTWTAKDGETFTGSFTIQCKFSQKPGQTLKASALSDEVEKAKRLAARGLADNYFLFTNMHVTGATDEALRKRFEAFPGVRRFQSYGAEQISQFIRESPRLRMLVPRVYGLGDLGQILDQRAYDQAQEILSSLGDDMNKFVMTDAFRASARALVEHGFVMLLGEPACGKSAIAAALALGALDEWGCSTVKIRDPSEFVAVSNPHETKQFFWADDAFGATQLDWQMASQWSTTFPHVRAAIRRGAKFVFTSRDYIYKNARSFLKESALPVLHDSQVIIRVEQLSKDEREQILYNHVRLGTQPVTFKKAIKPYLEGLAVHPRFSPEIARRLGNPAFTKELSVSEYGLDDFVARPVPLLQEIIRTLDVHSRAAIALVFMRGGWLTSPVSLRPEEETAVELIGATVAGVRTALPALDGSLLIHAQQKGVHGWRAKHPTILDAFAALVAESRELMDIYLTGTPIRELLTEIICGDVGLEGAKLDVPPDRFDGLITRLLSFYNERYENRDAVHRFLALRCEGAFLERFLTRCPQFIDQLVVRSYFYAVSDISVLNKLWALGLLSESERTKHVEDVGRFAVSTPDEGFLKPRVVGFIKDEEVKEILGEIRSELLPNLDSEVDNWKDNYSGDDSPSDYFETLKSTLGEFREALDGDVSVEGLLAQADVLIERAIARLEEQEPAEPDNDDYYARSASGPTLESSRSIFDDVDD
jgi:hypothetical protein